MSTLTSICTSAIRRILGALQDVDASVRDACVEALAALAHAAARAAGGALAGSSSANPFLRTVFECLAEQRRESQTAAGQALLQV
jgi:hypothetical protein